VFLPIGKPQKAIIFYLREYLLLFKKLLASLLSLILFILMASTGLWWIWTQSNILVTNHLSSA
jgi:hypothetical protein